MRKFTIQEPELLYCMNKNTVKLKIFPDGPQLVDRSSKLWEEEFLDGLKIDEFKH